jgi:D-alanyl-D-alanine carboxypeptidase (penicillin-binding protein 5/6)
MGSDSEVALVAPRDLSITIPAGILSKVQGMKIRYLGPVKAPIAKGQHIADLVVMTSDSGEQVMPLAAAEAVGEAGFFGRAWIGLKQMLGMA